MIDLAHRRWVRCLHEQGKSQRAIAQRTGLNRRTIRRILQRADDELEARLRAKRGAKKNPSGPQGAVEDDEDYEWFDEGPPRRCPSCGGLVFMPCVACWVSGEVVR